MILLAFVYKKYSYNRNLLKVFYDELNAQLGGKVLLHALDEQWVKESFAAVTQVEALNAIEQIFSAQDFMQSIKQHFAEFVYDAFQIRSFPAPVGYEKSSYEYEAGKKTALFADCMCNTMRNFINLYAYDAEQNKFTLEKLLAAMSIAAVHPALAKFLKDFDSVNMVSSLQAHNAWLTVISNIPYVAYNRMIDGSTGLSTGALETGKGYIAIPENERTDALLNWLKINRYQVVEKNQYGYELQPSVKNIIIVLDHLLQLNFFAAGGLSKEFMRSDFIAFYFSKLCMAVKATGYLSTQKGAKQEELDKNFDVLDYTETTIYMTFSAANITCKFTTSSGHGELKLNIILTDKQTFLFVEKINNFAGQPSLSLLVTNLICKQDISFDHLENNPNYLYINLFAAPVENTGNLNQIIRAVKYNIIEVMPLIIKVNSMGLLLRVADLQPDEVEGLNSKLEICKQFLTYLSEDDLKNNPQLVREIEKVILQGMKDSKKEQGIGLLLESLSNKGQSFAITAQLAEKMFLSDEYYIRNFAEDRLFPVLFRHKQGYKEAIRAAEQGIKTGSQAITLFRTLFEKGLGLQEAVQAAETLMTSEVYGDRSRAIDLFVTLFKKGVGFEEALRGAQKEVQSNDTKRRALALKLFKLLVDNDHAFKEAAQAIQYIDLKGGYRDIIMEAYAGSDLFDALVSKDQALAEAIEFATKSFVLNESMSFNLLEQLRTKVPEETEKAIQKALADRNVKREAKVKLYELLK